MIECIGAVCLAFGLGVLLSIALLRHWLWIGERNPAARRQVWQFLMTYPGLFHTSGDPTLPQFPPPTFNSPPPP